MEQFDEEFCKKQRIALVEEAKSEHPESADYFKPYFLNYFVPTYKDMIGIISTLNKEKIPYTVRICEELNNLPIMVLAILDTDEEGHPTYKSYSVAKELSNHTRR